MDREHTDSEPNINEDFDYEEYPPYPCNRTPVKNGEKPWKIQKSRCRLLNGLEEEATGVKKEEKA